MKNYFVFVLLLVILVYQSNELFSQGIRVDQAGVAVNFDDSSPDTSAILDIKSTTKGLLIPRVTTSQKNSINSPATGLMVFDTNMGQFYYFTGSTWNVIDSKIDSAKIMIGDTSGFGISRFMTGDANIDYLGAITINSGAVTTTKIADNSVNGSKIALSSDATGDVMYYDGSNYVRLAIGANGYFLKSNGTSPTWAAVTGDIDGVTAGNGLIGGGTSGTITLDVNTINGLTVNADTIRLGGTLNQNTIITQSTKSFTIANNGSANTIINLSSTGDFDVQDNGNSKLFVSDAGNVGINKNSSLYNTFDVNGGINISNSDSAYRISNVPILRIKGTGSLFVGSEAGINTSGNYNNINGFQAGYTNSSGTYNTFMGYQSGYSNTTSSYNSFEGSLSGYSNTTGAYNTCSGSNSGKLNVTGSQNAFFGAYAGFNSTSSYNTSVGSSAGYSNTSGSANIFMGQQSGYYNTTGGNNTMIGYHSGWTNTTGSNNTLIGYGANVNANNLTNATAIGNGAVAQGSNYVRIGNTSVTTSWVQVDWTIGSDARFKFNINNNVKGLEFIKKLRPVTYQMNTQQLDNFIIQNMSDSVKVMHQQSMDFAPSTSIVHSGFIAQEVDSAANACGFISSIVHKPSNSNDIYGLSYAEFVVPLVKAVQEQQVMIEALQAKNVALETKLIELETKVNSMTNH